LFGVEEMNDKVTNVTSAIYRTIFDAFVFAYLAIFAIVAVAQPTSEALTGQMTYNAGLFVGLGLLGAIISGMINARGIRTLGEVIYAPPHKRRTSSAAPQPLHKTVWGLQIILTLLVTLVLGFYLADVDIIRLLDKDSFDSAMNLFQQLARPDWQILPKAIMKIIESIFIAFMATAIAVPLAFVLSFFMARNLAKGSGLRMAAYLILRMIFNVSRSVEPVLWAIIFSVWVSFGPFAGMLALMIHSIASLAKQYSEIVEGVDEGPIEGIESTGASRLQMIWFAVVPQVVLPYISYTIYRWDTNVRMATILGFVGGGGIGTMLMEYQGQAQWPQVGTIIIVIAFTVWIMDAFSAHIRSAIK
jgi:phosphonate transport system permease protein